MENMAKILIVDDDAKLRKTLSDILSAKGYATIDAANGKAALNKVKSEAPAVALIDLKLTDISGIEVMKGIKKLSPETECIILTGYSSRETAVEAVNLGAFNYMNKPYDIEKLLLIIQRAVEKGESEKALKESEEKWRGLFENSIEAAFTVDLKGKFTLINSALASVMGYKKEEIIGRNYKEFAPPKITDAVFQEYNRLYHTGKPIRGFVYETTRKSGEVRTVETYVNTIRKGGEIVGFQGTLKDITEQKRAEEALKNSEEKFRTVADFTYDWEYWRGIDGKFIYVSPSVERITGYSPKEIANDAKFIERIVHPEDRYLLREHKRTIKQDIKECSLNFRIITKSGEARWIGHVCQSVYDMEGNLLGRRGSNRDITNRKLAEDHIINLNRLLKSIRDINQLIVREKDRVSLLQEACEILVLVGGYHLAWIGFVDKEEKKVIPVAQSGFEEGYLDTITITWDDKNTGKGPTGTAVRTKKSCVFNDIVNNPNYKPWKSQAEKRGYKSSASFPLIYNGKVHYALNVYSDSIDFFDGEEIELLEEVSQDLAFALSAIESEEERKRAEEELSRSEERYRSLVENLNDVVFTLDMNGRISYISPAVENISKYSLDEIMGKSFTRFVYPEDIPSLKSVFNLDDADIEETFEFRVLDKDGEIRYVRVSSRMKMENGEPVGLTGIMTDITESRKAKEALEASELKYRQLVESASVGVAIAQDGFLKFINPIFSKILGHPEEELLESRFIDLLVHPDDKRRAYESHERRVKGEEMPHLIEYRIVDDKGNIKWVEVNGVATTWEGKPAALNFVVDITERKVAEEALEASELKYRQLVESASVGVAIAQDGVFKFVNPMLLEILGHPEEDLLTHPFFDLVMHPDDREKAIEIHKKRVKGEELPYFTEYRIIDKNGNIKWVEVNGISTEWEGKPAALNFVSDITERKTAEEALKESEERYRTLVENLNDVIFNMDSEGKISYLSPVVETISDYKVEELVGRPFVELIHPDDVEGLMESYMKTLKGEYEPYEFRVVKKDRTYFHVNTSSKLVFKDGKVVGTSGVLTDITERKKAEDALEASEFKYRQLFESASVGIAIGQDGMFKFFNPIMSEMLGRSDEELFSKRFIEFAHPDDRDRALETHYKRIKGEEVPYLTEYKIIDGEGNIKWVEVNGVTTTWEGKPAALNFISDVTERKKAEEALIESEERFRIAAESSSDLIYEWDITTDSINWYGDIDGKLGYKKNEFERTLNAWLESIHPDDRERLRKIAEDHRKTGEPISVEYKIGRKDGSWRYWMDQGTAMLDRAGKPVKLIGACMDITERKVAEEALRESEERFRSALDNMMEGCQIIGYDWRYLYINDVAARHGRCKKEGLLGRTMIESYPGIENTKIFEIMKECMEKRTARFVENEFEFQDGTKDWFELSIQPIKEGIFILSVDITERKKAADALKESEERYKNLVENLNDAIFNLDTEGKILYLSPVIETISDYKVEDLIGRPFAELVHPGDLKGLLESYEKTAMGRYEPYEFRVMRKDGTYLYVNTSSRLILKNGDVVGISGVLTDITERKRAEEALIEEKEKAKLYLNTAGVILIALNGKGEITLLNKKGHEILGYKEGEITGKNWFRTCVPERRRKEVESVFKKLMSRDVETSEYVENLILTKSGEERIIAWHNTVIMGKDSEIVGTLSSGEDITERKRAEENLIENTLYFRSLIDTLHEDIVVIDGDLRVTDINSSFLKKTESARDDILGKPCYDVYRGYEDECASYGNFCPHRIVFKTGENVQVVHEHKKEDGTIQYIDILASPLKDNTGRVVKVVEAMRDVTDIYRAHDRIRESEEKFRSFFETSRDVVYLSTVDGKFEDINRSGEKLFGYKRSELLSIDLKRLYDDPDKRAAFIKNIEENGFVKDYEIVLKRKDGTKIDSLITAAVRLDRENRVIGYQGIVRDITERKKLETKLIQTEKLSSLGGILSGVAHELNNPLTSIIGNAQLLARKDCASDVMKKLEVIQKESFRCTKIVGGLLSFAREHKPERKMIQVNDVLKESYRLREYELRMNDIDFELELYEDIPKTSADPYQLQQVFINLINNAHDALRDEGGGSLVVRSLFKDNNIILEFEDDGPGISTKDLNSIFDPFFTTKEVGEGTGLGLSIVYGIIKEHDGEIRVESVQGEGARFTIELPVVDEFSDEESITDQKEIRRDGGGKAVLIVEDEKSLRDLIMDALLHEDYIVNACGSVERGIELLADNHYDIVISDMKMPGLGGKDLYRFIEKQYPSLLKKVLFVTGDVLGKETQDFFKDTGVEYVEKPFMIEDLLDRVLKLSNDSE